MAGGLIAIIVGWIAGLGVVIRLGCKWSAYLDAHDLRDDTDYWDS